jgi:hypothetical protein
MCDELPVAAPEFNIIEMPANPLHPVWITYRNHGIRQFFGSEI